MSKVPSLSYIQIVKALQRNGWIIVRQKGSHIRLQKHIGDEVLKITVPAHRPVKPSTLAGFSIFITQALRFYKASEHIYIYSGSYFFIGAPQILQKRADCCLSSDL